MMNKMPKYININGQDYVDVETLLLAIDAIETFYCSNASVHIVHKDLDKISGIYDTLTKSWIDYRYPDR